MIIWFGLTTIVDSFSHIDLERKNDIFFSYFQVDQSENV